MPRKYGLTRQIARVFDQKMAIGQSKKDDRDAFRDGDKSRDPSQKIYSYETKHTYLKQTIAGAKWIKANCENIRTLDDVRAHLGDYFAAKNDAWSASTRTTVVSAFAKLYGITAPELREELGLPERERSYKDVTRSRSDAARDYGFSEEKNSDLIDFARSTGLRRSELETVRGSDLREKSNGDFEIYVKGKGGRERYAPVIGDADRVARVVEMCRAADKGKVFERVHSHADIHSYRRDYATEIYESRARSFADCKADPFYNQEHRNSDGSRGGYDRDSVYHFRDGSGGWLDKKAMRAASEALGHSRISVVGEHYIKR